MNAYNNFDKFYSEKKHYSELLQIYNKAIIKNKKKKFNESS